MAQSRSFFDDVKRELECSVCQDQFSETNEPKILKCLHTFCKSCLEAWLRQCGGALSCPTCRQITDCANNDINSLPSNLFYKQMVDIVKAYSGQGQEDSPHCGNCDERKSLKFYCADCNHFLCEECAGAHRKMKTLSGHQVKEIGKFRPSDARDYARRANVCKKHNDEVRFYCEQCVICICRDCAILDHRDHNIVSLDNGLQKKKSVIEKKMKQLQENVPRLRNEKESLENRRAKINKSIEQATEELHKTAEHNIQLIRQHQASVTERLMKQKETFDAAFSNTMTGLDEKLIEIKSSLDFGNEILQRNNLPEILNVEEVLEQRFQELMEPCAFDLKVDYSAVKYVSNDLSSLKDSSGKLVTSNTEPSLTMTDGRGLTEGVKGEDCSFRVITKDSQGNKTYSEIDGVEVCIQSLQTGKSVKVTITDSQDGCYRVSYKSEATGEFNVVIKVAGEAIKGSPFQLKVEERKGRHESRCDWVESPASRDDPFLGRWQARDTLKRYTSQESSSTTSPHQGRHPRPFSEEQGSSSTSNVVGDHPAFSLTDNWSDRPSKKTGEDDKLPNKGVVPNAESNESHEQMPDNINKGHSANKNIAVANKDSPDTDMETSNVDTKVNTSMKGRELSNEVTSVKPLRGKRKGITANFSERSHGETGSKSSGSTQLSGETGEAKSGRGRGMTYAAIISPPGLTVSEEGLRLASDNASPVKGDQDTDPAELLVKEKQESERKESNDGANANENQESRDKCLKIDKDKLNDVSGSKVPPYDGISDPQKAEETKKNTVENPLTDDERRLPTEENSNNPTGLMQRDNKPETGMQLDQSSSSTVNHEASYREEPPPPNHLESSLAAEAIAPTTSHGSVNVQDTVNERPVSSDTVSEPLMKMQTTHPTSEPKCSMCMNMNKDPVYRNNCGHWFCKSCKKCFIEKATMCPVCKKENLFRGNQPVGCIVWRTESNNSLPGYEKYGTIVITYNFKEGIQGLDHPNPGEPYSGLFCTSYLPNNPAGQELFKLLKSAFLARLIFTIGQCLSTGEENKIVSNGIELKWNRSGGPANCGYPDPSYLDRVKSQLAKRGITQVWEYV